MKKIKIGIPRSLTYHRYNLLWKKFFEYLGCKIILSPITNKKIIELGSNTITNEECLCYKIYIGHITFLKDSCDYILIPQINNYGKKEKVCKKISETINIVKQILPSNKIISYTIDHLHYKYEPLEFIKMGLKINKNIIRILIAYILAKKKQKYYEIVQENEQKNELNSPNKKILIVSNFYNICDNYISSYIINFLKNQNITIIYSNKLNKKTAKTFSKYYSNTLNITYSKEIIGSLHYYKYMIDGIIFLKSQHCYIDNLVNALAIHQNNNIPIVNINIDECEFISKIETKLECFLDTIQKYKNKQ